MFSDFQYRFCWQYTLLSQSLLLSLLAVVWITSKKLMLKTLKLKLLYIIKRWLKKKSTKSHLQWGRPRFDSWVRKIPQRRGRLPIPVFLGFPCGSAGKEFTHNVGDLGSIPGLGRSPGEGKGYPLQYSGLEKSMDCPWGHKELDKIEQLSLSFKSRKQIIETSSKIFDIVTVLSFQTISSWGNIRNNPRKTLLTSLKQLLKCQPDSKFKKAKSLLREHLDKYNRSSGCL